MKNDKKTVTQKGGNKREEKGADMNCASGNMKRIPKEMALHDDESCHDIFPSSEAMEELIYGIAGWVDVQTFLEIADLMRGLDDKLALKVASYVRNFCVGLGRTITGLEHLDSQLLSIYRSIYEQAKAQGKKLEIRCPF